LAGAGGPANVRAAPQPRQAAKTTLFAAANEANVRAKRRRRLCANKLSTFRWKGQDGLDRLRPRRQHQGAVKPQRNTGAFRQAVLQRGEQKLIRIKRGQACPAALGIVAFETRPLLGSGCQLLEAVRQLNPVAVKLEAQRGPRIVWIETRQGGLGGRVAVHEGKRFFPKMRAYGRAHEQLEKLIALCIRCGSESQLLRLPLQLSRSRCKRVQLQLTQKSFAVGYAFARMPGRDRAKEGADERVHFAHQVLEGEADAVPLNQREFRIVQPAALETAHDVANLVDVAAARRQQALHAVLG